MSSGKLPALSPAAHENVITVVLISYIRGFEPYSCFALFQTAV